MRISDWSSDVGSSDLRHAPACENPWSGYTNGAGAMVERRNDWGLLRNPPGDDELTRKKRIGGETIGGFARLRGIEIGRAHVCTPVTNAPLVCRLLLETKKKQTVIRTHDNTRHIRNMT